MELRQAIVIAPDAGSLERVAGLTAVTRAVLTLREGGADDIVVVCASPRVRQALALDARLPGGGVRLRLADGGDVAAAVRALAGELDTPFLVARADRGFDAARVRALLDRGVPGGQVARIAVRDGALLVAHDGDDAVRALTTAAGDADDLTTAAGRRRAEDRLFRALTKPTDGWASRHLNRPLSLRLTRLLLDTKVTPNQVTVVAAIIGFTGIWLVGEAMWWTVMLGAFFVHAQSVLDGCDGELARLKFMSSPFGEWLDNVLDDSMNIAYGFALGHASAELFDAPVFLWLGIGTAAGYAIYNAVLYAHLWLVFRRGNPFLFRWWFQRQDAYLQESLAGGGWSARFVGVVHALGRRDVFLLAFFVLCLVRLPQVATLWYFTIAAVSAALAILHVIAGGIRRGQDHQRSAASTRSA